MRLLLFFDLPVTTSKERKSYRLFVKNIKKSGFYMLQESVYVKMAINQQLADSIVSKVKTFLPLEGNVMILTITEKQFSSIEILLGNNKTDVVNSDERVLIL